MTTLSAYYEHRPPLHPPTFEKFLDTPPRCPPALLASTLQYIPNYAVDYPADDLLKMIAHRKDTTERVYLRFTVGHLGKLKARACKSTGNPMLTSMQSLAGYLATILNRIDDAPVQAINYRLGVNNFSHLNLLSEMTTPISF